MGDYQKELDKIKEKEKQVRSRDTQWKYSQLRFRTKKMKDIKQIHTELQIFIPTRLMTLYQKF